MHLLSPFGVTLLYAWLYGPLFGMIAGLLVAFVLFCVSVATHPMTVETDSARAEREKLNRDVAALVLITAVFGCAISSLLQ